MENYNFEVLESDKVQIGEKIIDLHTVAKEKLAKMLTRYQSRVGTDDDIYNGGYYEKASDTIARVLKQRTQNPALATEPTELLKQARDSKVGSTIVCPQCRKQFVKKNTQMTFCSNGRGGGANCKDRYWNLHDPVRKAKLDNIHLNYK